MGSMETSAQQSWRGGNRRGDGPGDRTTRRGKVSGGDRGGATGRPISSFPGERKAGGNPPGGVISPLLANIYRNKLDRIGAARWGQLGVLVRYADDFVARCRTESQAREALRRIGRV